MVKGAGPRRHDQVIGGGWGLVAPDQTSDRDIAVAAADGARVPIQAKICRARQVVISTVHDGTIRRHPRRGLGAHARLDSQASTQSQRRPTAERQPQGHVRNRLQAQDRVPMGCHPPRVRQRQRVLPAVPAVASGGRVPHDARGDGPLLRPACWRRPELVLARQRHCQGTKRGDLTGPSPTDRAKLGTKRHILTDADGVPLAVTITGANVHDKWMVGQTLDAMVLRGPRGPRRPRTCASTKATTTPTVSRRFAAVESFLTSAGEAKPPLVGCVHSRPRRWVVERTNSWHNRYRGLLIRWERKAENYLAFVRLACALIAFNAASRA